MGGKLEYKRAKIKNPDVKYSSLKDNHTNFLLLSMKKSFGPKQIYSKMKFIFRYDDFNRNFKLQSTFLSKQCYYSNKNIVNFVSLSILPFK